MVKEVLEDIFKKFRYKNQKNLEIKLGNNQLGLDLAITLFKNYPKKIEKVDFQKEEDNYFIYYSTFYISNGKDTFLNYPKNLKKYFFLEPLKNFEKKVREELKKPKVKGYETALFLREKIMENEIENAFIFFVKRFEEKIRNLS
ncbi:MAG: hypothetical protein QXO12_00700 [Candidatus Pacearchaeota archaeon]